MHYYRAYFKTKAKIISLPSDIQEGNTLNIRFVNRGKAVPIYAYKKARHDLAQGKLALGWYNIGLWPRTNKQGSLVQGTSITFAIPVEEEFEELGVVVGRFVDAGNKRGVLVVNVFPNEGGKLKRNFKLTLKANEEIVNFCKGLEEDESIIVTCHIDENTAQLVADDVEVIELPDVT